MTAVGRRQKKKSASAERSWGFSLLTKSEPRRRNRRTIDSVLLLVAAAALGFSAVITSSAPSQDADIAQALTTVLGWAGGFWRTVFVIALGLAVWIVVDVVTRKRWDLIRDLVVAGLALGGASVLLGGTVGTDWLPVGDHLMSRWGYPEPRLAAAAAVVVVVGPELIRPVRVLATWLVPLAALGSVAFGIALPSDVLGGLALGLGIGAFVRLIFGTAAGVPPTKDVEHALEILGVAIADLRPAARQRIGSAEYVGHDRNGSH